MILVDYFTFLSIRCRFYPFLSLREGEGDFSIFGQFLSVFIYLNIIYPSSLRWMVGTYHVKNEFGTDEYDIKTATKGNYEMGGGGGGV